MHQKKHIQKAFQIYEVSVYGNLSKITICEQKTQQKGIVKNLRLLYIILLIALHLLS